MIFQFIRMKIHNNHDYIALYFLVDTQSLWISQLKQMITLLLLQKDIYIFIIEKISTTNLVQMHILKRKKLISC